MMSVKKLTLGLRPETKAFRVSSLDGLVVDAILDARGKEIPETYYTQIAETRDTGKANSVSLQNSEKSNALLVDRENITFTKSAYPNSHINLDETISEFKNVWDVIQKVLKLKGIRRIGLVAEHRFEPAKNSSMELLRTLTKLPDRANPASFSLHYESRLPIKPGIPIDAVKGAFTNLIYDFYDSALDTSSPEAGKINANLDYQTYYAPSLDARIVDEIETNFYAFKKELVNFEQELVRLGLRK